MAKRTPADAGEQHAPPLKPARKRVKRLGKVEGGSKTAQELGIEVEGAGGLDYGDSPIPPPNSRERDDKTPPHLQGKTIFPAPESFKMSWGNFYKYWQVLWNDPQYRPRLRLHVYRTWPILIDGKRKVATLNGMLDTDVSSTAIEAKPLAVQDMLHMWGSGSYHIKLHDIGAAHRNICSTHLERAELRNTDYPPLLNVDDLDPADPLNATFLKQIQSRRSRGEEFQEADMAGELVEMAKLALDATKDSKGSDPASTAAMDVMAHAAKTGMDLVAEAAKKDPPPAPPATPQINPMELITSVLGLVKEIGGGGGGNDKYMEALRLAQESERAMHKSQIEFMQAQMKEMREAATTSAAAAQAAPPLKPEGTSTGGMVEKMREIVEMKDLARELTGRGGGGSAWADLAPVAVQAAQPLIQGLSMWLSSQATGGAQTAPQTGQVPQPGAGPTQPGLSPEIAGAMEQLRAPLMRIFNDPERDGADFAYFFVDMAGEDAYRQLTSVGPEQLHSFIMSYQPLAQELAGRGEKLQKFVFEFMDAFHQAPEDGEQQPPEEQEQADAAAAQPVPMPPMPGVGYFGYGSAVPPSVPVEPEEPADSTAPVEVLDAELVEPTVDTPPNPELEAPTEELTPPTPEAEAKPIKKKAAKRAKEK